MSKVVLEGGTDVAEMVLFSLDGLPSGGADDDTLSDLVGKNQAIRMLTGADGGYLLHLFVDEEIPGTVMQYCVADDALESEFRAESGQVAFGGAESTFVEFEPNPSIRADGNISPGVYDAAAYHTEYPDKLVEKAVQEVIGRDGARVVNFPGKIILGTVIATIAFLIYGFNVNLMGLGGAVAAIVGGVFWFKSHAGSNKYKELMARKLKVEYEYPSIVIAMARREM